MHLACRNVLLSSVFFLHQPAQVPVQGSGAGTSAGPSELPHELPARGAEVPSSPSLSGSDGELGKRKSVADRAPLLQYVLPPPPGLAALLPRLARLGHISIMDQTHLAARPRKASHCDTRALSSVGVWVCAALVSAAQVKKTKAAVKAKAKARLAKAAKAKARRGVADAADAEEQQPRTLVV